MASKHRVELARDLARGRDRLAAWRRTRTDRGRIPERLWAMAVQLAGKHGIHRTAQALKLEYYSLKKRVQAAERQRASRSAYVEIPGAFAPVPECVIELEDGAVSLRVHLKGYSAADAVAVGRSVRGG